MTIGHRLSTIRKSPTVKMTQAEFASSIGLARAAYAMYEVDKNTPPPATIKLICMTYHVNQVWLETGVGEMYDMDTDDTAESLVPDLVDILNSNPALLRVVRSAARHMTAQDWERLNVFIELCAEDFIAAKASDTDPAQESTEE